MTLLALESWDGIATADLTAKGWAPSGTAGNWAVSSARARTGGNGLLLSGGSNLAASGKVTRALGASEHATVIIGGAVYRTGGSAAATIMQALSDGGGTTHATISITPSGAIEVRRGLISGAVLGISAAGVVPVDAWAYVEAKLTLSDTVGTVDVRVNGVSVLSLTNQDTKNAGTKTVYDTVSLIATETSNTVTWDDVYVANGAGSVNNTFLGDLRVRCLVPTGNGNSSQLLGSDANSTNNYLLVDDVPPDTADYVGSATLDQKDTYAFGDLPDTSGTVLGVQISALATKTDSAARNLALVTRSAGADYDGSDVALALSTNAYAQQIRETDPATSAAWLRAAVDAAEFGVKVR